MTFSDGERWLFIENRVRFNVKRLVLIDQVNLGGNGSSVEHFRSIHFSRAQVAKHKVYVGESIEQAFTKGAALGLVKCVLQQHSKADATYQRHTKFQKLNIAENNKSQTDPPVRGRQDSFGTAPSLVVYLKTVDSTVVSQLGDDMSRQLRARQDMIRDTKTGTRSQLKGAHRQQHFGFWCSVSAISVPAHVTVVNSFGLIKTHFIYRTFHKWTYFHRILDMNILMLRNLGALIFLVPNSKVADAQKVHSTLACSRLGRYGFNINPSRAIRCKETNVQHVF